MILGNMGGNGLVLQPTVVGVGWCMYVHMCVQVCVNICTCAFVFVAIFKYIL